MRSKIAFLVVLAVSEIALDGGQWITDHLAVGRLVAALMGPTIDAGDRNGLHPH